MKRFFLTLSFLVFFMAEAFTQSTVSSVISNLKATLKEVDDDSAVIVLNWKVPKKNDITEYQIYRHSSQINKDNIKTLEPIEILVGKYTSYVDNVSDLSKEHYYSVITKNRKGEIYDIIIPTVNTTVTPIIPVPKQTVFTENINKPGRLETRENERELIPLPFLNEFDFTGTQKIDIPQKNIDMAKKLSAKTTEMKSKQIQILDADKVPDSGDQYLLSTIVNTSFAASNWDQAEKELNDFIKMNREESTISRAYFYLGQIYYYEGKSRDALDSFMFSMNDYPVQSRQWIDEVLNQFEIKQLN